MQHRRLSFAVANTGTPGSGPRARPGTLQIGTPRSSSPNASGLMIVDVKPIPRSMDHETIRSRKASGRRLKRSVAAVCKGPSVELLPMRVAGRPQESYNPLAL